jgi:predicted Zn finger-like uncharacterized protein
LIARCPDCQARYLIAREKIGPRGARLRCTRCSRVFRVVADPSASKSRVADPAPPAATHAPLPSVARAIVAEPNSAVAAEVLAYLEQWRIKAVHVKDGGETLLRTLRSRPELVIVGDRLPGIAGPELTEIFRRVSDLKGVRIIHVTSIARGSRGSAQAPGHRCATQGHGAARGRATPGEEATGRSPNCRKRTAGDAPAPCTFPPRTPTASAGAAGAAPA